MGKKRALTMIGLMAASLLSRTAPARAASANSAPEAASANAGQYFDGSVLKTRSTPVAAAGASATLQTMGSKAGAPAALTAAPPTTASAKTVPSPSASPAAKSSAAGSGSSNFWGKVRTFLVRAGKLAVVGAVVVGFLAGGWVGPAVGAGLGLIAAAVSMFFWH